MNERIDILWKGMDRIHAMLQFAEAKNALLLTLIIASQVGILQAKILPRWSDTGSCWSTVGLAASGVAIFISAISFIPNTRIVGSSDKLKRNSLYYDDASHMEANDINIQLSGNIDSICNLISDQIRQEARICAIKMRFFNFTLIFFIIYIISIAASVAASEI